MPHVASLEPHAVWFRPYVVKPTRVGDVKQEILNRSRVGAVDVLIVSQN